MRRLAMLCVAACGGGGSAAPDGPGAADAPIDALPILTSTISDCAAATGACAAADLAVTDHTVSPMLFGDGIEWSGYGQDVLAPDGTLRPDVMAALAATGITLM